MPGNKFVIQPNIVGFVIPFTIIKWNYQICNKFLIRLTAGRIMLMVNGFRYTLEIPLIELKNNP